MAKAKGFHHVQQLAAIAVSNYEQKRGDAYRNALITRREATLSDLLRAAALNTISVRTSPFTPETSRQYCSGTLLVHPDDVAATAELLHSDADAGLIAAAASESGVAAASFSRLTSDSDVSIVSS